MHPLAPVPPSRAEPARGAGVGETQWRVWLARLRVRPPCSPARAPGLPRTGCRRRAGPRGGLAGRSAQAPLAARVPSESLCNANSSSSHMCVSDKGLSWGLRPLQGRCLPGPTCAQGDDSARLGQAAACGPALGGPELGCTEVPRLSPRACGRVVPLRVLRDVSTLLPAHTLVARYLALGRHLSYLGETFSTRFLEKNQKILIEQDGLKHPRLSFCGCVIPSRSERGAAFQGARCHTRRAVGARQAPAGSVTVTAPGTSRTSAGLSEPGAGCVLWSSVCTRVTASPILAERVARGTLWRKQPGQNAEPGQTPLWVVTILPLGLMGTFYVFVCLFVRL